ncbi:putative N-acetyltransferase YhbS [Dysgonomonas sp. PH5-45]|uniref:GNAT family N-acetyltransferase n=1 Tax=unclassified Dysgonomonas TaxID=2630389 RepID=UPI0024759DC6|nr:MULTISPECIES: N-acetyltransferase [unclassified Dysgonomonas]MDH6355956.1 putative N-acetyltransferase YhbS [Dysgonomonas sp. PH5-45]MDH6388843.1 putative N-acetyltransferase YhbS [Dysgonomonas sp. PH5-37]
MDKTPTIKIRQETERDHKAVERLVEAAFRDEVYSSQNEHILVEKLRRTSAFVPELSLVAVSGRKIVGHILFTKVSIGYHTSTLALAPLSVHPEFQNRGIGGKLIAEGHKIAKELGFDSVLVVGHEDYYKRFGYKQLSDFGIQVPFTVPVEYAMGYDLIPNVFFKISGIATYPKEFFE